MKEPGPDWRLTAALSSICGGLIKIISISCAPESWQAAQRGVYVSVVLFQSLNATSKKQQDNPWYANPLNRDNNINGINGDTNGNGVGDEAFTLAIPAITTLQEAYIRKVVDTLNNLDNVLYEISADGPLGNPVWQNYIINYLKSYQATKLNQHPIGIGHLSGTNTEDVFASPADWITFYGADLNPPWRPEERFSF